VNNLKSSKQFACQAARPWENTVLAARNEKGCWVEGRPALTNIREITNFPDQSWRAGDVRLFPFIKPATLEHAVIEEDFQEVTGKTRSLIAWHPICNGIIPEL